MTRSRSFRRWSTPMCRPIPVRQQAWHAWPPCTASSPPTTPSAAWSRCAKADRKIATWFCWCRHRFQFREWLRGVRCADAGGRYLKGRRLLMTDSSRLDLPVPAAGQESRRRSLARLATDVFDVLVIGGGVTAVLYTSDAADDLLCVDLGGRRIIKKK